MIRSQRSPTGCGNGSRSAPAADGNSSASFGFAAGVTGAGGSGATATTTGGGGSAGTGEGVAHAASSAASPIERQWCRRKFVIRCRQAWPTQQAGAPQPKLQAMVGSGPTTVNRRRGAPPPESNTQFALEGVLPRAQRGKRRDVVGQRPPRMALRRRADIGPGGAQERIGRALEPDRRRQRRLAALPRGRVAHLPCPRRRGCAVRPPVRSEGSPACTRARNRRAWPAAAPRARTATPTSARACPRTAGRIPRRTACRRRRGRAPRRSRRSTRRARPCARGCRGPTACPAAPARRCDRRPRPRSCGPECVRARGRTRARGSARGARRRRRRDRRDGAWRGSPSARGRAPRDRRAPAPRRRDRRRRRRARPAAARCSCP